MATTYNRRINLYINGKEIKNDIKSVRNEMYNLTNQQARMTIGSKEYNQKTREIAKLKGILSDHNAQIRGTASLWQKTAGVFKSILPIFSAGAIVAGIGKFVGKMNEVIDVANNFEERLDNLSALTGLQGSELEKLGDIAKKTSVKITNGNVRIKQSADDIVDAYTKVGSQRPELLKNAEALASVTEDAIILSEAAKSKLDPAVSGLTTTMNQFNLGASESRRIINAMAAGSKEGAADIPYLTQAIEKSGTTMHLMNVSLEENIGLIESIAPNYAKAELAGNSLDKVFLKLKEKNIGFVNGTFSVNAALDELAKRYKNGESAASIFGVEHAKMGELLVQNKDEFNRYTKAVTGTNTAIEQAAKNTNNAAAIQAQARNEFHNLSIELGSNLSPAMNAVYKAAGSLAAAFTKMIESSPADSLRKENAELNSLVTSIIAANDNQKVRNSLVTELQSKYPDFLGNIDAEKVSNEQLKKMLIGVNAQYKERIKLAALQEKTTEIQAKGIDLAAREQQIIESVNRSFQQFRYDGLGFADTFEEQVAAFAEAGERHGFIPKGVLLAVKNLGKEYSNVQDKIKANVTEYEKWATLAAKVQDKLNASGAETGNSGNSNPNSNTDFTNRQELPTNPIPTSFPNRKNDYVSMFEQETDAPIDDGWINQKMQADIELFAEKKRSEEEWTAFLKQQIDERTTAELDSLAKEAEITEARKELKGVYADAIGQVAAALASMFKEGSAAQIAALVVEKSAAIAQIIFQTAIANAKAVAASPLTFGQPWVTINTISAGASIAAIAATTISSFKDKKNNNKPGFAEGGYTNGERMYIAGEAGTEWISPNWMTTHPITGPVISNLESLRKNGPTLNPEAIRMFASGGYTNVHQKMNENNSNNYGGDLYGFRGAKMDKMQNEVLTELVNGLKSNTEALKNIKVYASIEDIKKADKNYVDIQNTRGL